MTNNWVDIDYSSLIYVQGANPAENHPACMGHINGARFSNKTIPGVAGKTGAQMIVVDPRQTRTARQIDPSKGDRFIRIRPGTDIAFINAVLNTIITRMYAAVAAGSSDPDFATATNFFAWHNTTSTAHGSFGRSFIDDGGTSRTLTKTELASAEYSSDGGTTWYAANLTTGWPKYCDSRVMVNGTTSAAVEYDRVKLRTASNAAHATNWVFSGVPEFAANVSVAGTVFKRLQAHVAHYTPTVAAGICGCQTTDVEYVADRFIQHSRMASEDFAVGAPFAAVPGNAAAAFARPTNAGYRATTILYAMGITQHTYGSQNIRDYAIIQTLLGNMGRQGGGINALRGIHNVQGSTDMATLFDGIPGYSGNPGTTQIGADGYVAYANPLFGNRLINATNKGGKDPYTRTSLGLQQLGFYNMTHQWFGETLTGSTAVTDDAVVIGGMPWTTLAKKPIDAGTVVVKGSGTNSGVTYVEGTDYEIDYTGGRIRAKVGTSFTNAVLLVSYTYAVGTVVTDEVATVTTDRTAMRYLPSTAVVNLPVEAAPAPVVKNTVGDVTYTEGSDYSINLATGTITAMVGSKLADATSYNVTYTSGATAYTNPVVVSIKSVLSKSDLKKATPSTFVVTSSPATTTYPVADYSVAWLTGALTIKNKTLASGTPLLVDYEYWSRLSDADFVRLYNLWPKGNGFQHTEAIRMMEKGDIKAAVVWGQNPAITEPNQTVVRAAFEKLDLLVCVDIFANETAQMKRKAGAPTYLFPACSHVEEAGSVTNSGRWIQWRDKAAAPKGNSKADLELLLRFSKALADAGLFDHIVNQWKLITAYASKVAGTDAANRTAVWRSLYGKHGWDAYGAVAFEAAAGTTAEGVAITGSEYVAEQVFKEITRPLDDPTVAGGGGGTLWIYSGMGAASAYNEVDKTNVQPAVKDSAGVAMDWGIANRAKVRMGDVKYASGSGSYPRYGWAWLLNRRVFYNNSEVLDDVADVFVAPGVMSRLFTVTTTAIADFSALYRSYNALKDMPDAGVDVVHVHPGRFPAHTEPIESPRPALVAKYGNNTSDGKKLYVDAAMATAKGWIKTEVGAYGDSIADPTKFDLVLTTIRCVEHFQGGPTTRNNPWNHELEPEPWVEINSADALKFGIKDGDWVDVVTARGNSKGTQNTATTHVNAPVDPANAANDDSAGFAKGFKARVGVGTLANQRVAPGVVAIPWHWGERGLSKGSRANDLCIDAWDANTMIPEYKACLCRIRKMV